MPSPEEIKQIIIEADVFKYDEKVFDEMSKHMSEAIYIGYDISEILEDYHEDVHEELVGIIMQIIPESEPEPEPDSDSELTRYYFTDTIPINAELLLVDIGVSSNCEEDDGAYLNIKCIMSRKRYCKLKQHIVDKKLCIHDDCSSGGHGCIIEASNQDIVDNMYCIPISYDEAKTLKKFWADSYKDSEWYNKLLGN